MSKLMLFVCSASAALALTGCPGKERSGEATGSAKPGEATKPIEAKPGEAKPGEAKPGEAKPGEAKPGEAKPDELPAECGAYKALADKLASCDALGAQRDTLRGEFDKAWKAWELLPKDERTKLSDTCKTASEALTKAAATACKW